MSEPSIIKPEDINPNYQWHRRVPSHGTMNVDYEERINFQRLHKYRLGRAKQALNNSKAGSLLCFDNNNIRYLTSTVIGEWSRDKIARYSPMQFPLLYLQVLGIYLLDMWTGKC